MDIATQTHLLSLRGLLAYRAGELKAELHAARLAAQAAQLTPQEVHDQKDDAAERASEAIDDAERARDAAELTRVQAALRRLDNGTYGDCLDCGEPVGLERLRVQPAAERCAGCQAAFELGTRRGAARP
jgi:RNA polymerase-binding protein DksA